MSAQLVLDLSCGVGVAYRYSGRLSDCFRLYHRLAMRPPVSPHRRLFSLSGTGRNIDSAFYLFLTIWGLSLTLE
jgi:hypothetical protein